LRCAFLLACVCAGLVAVLADAAPFGTLTLLEGGGDLLRGTSRYTLAEGVRLEPGDIVEFPEKSLAQIEFTDGSLLALGPHSRLLSFPVSATKPAIEFFLLQGVVKVMVPKSEAATGLRFTTPQMSLSVADATAVLRATADESAVFMERGETHVKDEGAQAAAIGLTLIRSGEYFARKTDQKGTVSPRPPQSFIAALPRTFLDALPSRLAKFKDVDVAPQKGPDFTYADVEAWLKSTPPVRKVLVPRWRPKARDRAFRSAVAANMKDHPEWDRILYPEKYLPKPKPIELPKSY
jgi:hypothetical protein